MASEFKLLKLFSGLFKVTAWTLLLVIAGVGSVAIFMGSDAAQPMPKWSFLMNVLTGLFWFVIFYTISEIIKLLLAIEAQSRRP